MAAFDDFGLQDLSGFGTPVDDSPDFPTIPDLSQFGAPVDPGAQASARPQFSFSPEDRDTAIRTIYGEAALGGPDEMAAVANVLKNRAKKAGTSLRAEALKKGQFEPWMWAESIKRMQDLDPESDDYKAIAAVIDPILNDEADDITGGATHFYAPKAQRKLGRRPPKWSHGQQGQPFGRQMFYALPYGDDTGEQAGAPIEGAPLDLAPGTKAFGFQGKDAEPDLVQQLFALPPDERPAFIDKFVHDTLGVPLDLRAPQGTLGDGGVPPLPDNGLPSRNPQRQKPALFQPWEVLGKTSEGRPVVYNEAEGGPSTEISITVEDPRTPGRWINIPSLYGGKPVEQDQALDIIDKNGFVDPETGHVIDSFPTIGAAERAAQKRTKSLDNDPGVQAAFDEIVRRQAPDAFTGPDAAAPDLSQFGELVPDLKKFPGDPGYVAPEQSFADRAATFAKGVSALNQVTFALSNWDAIKEWNKATAEGIVGTMAGLGLKGVAGWEAGLDYFGTDTLHKYRDKLAKVPQMTEPELRGWFEELNRPSDKGGANIVERYFLSQALKDIKAGKLTPDMLADLPDPKRVEDREIYKAGERVKKWSEKTFAAAPGWEESITRQLGEGFGSFVGGLPFALAGPVSATVAFSALGSGEATERAIEYRRKIEQAVELARETGLDDKALKALQAKSPTEKQIIVAGIYGIAPGATDIVPIEIALGLLKVPASARRPLATAIARIGGQAFVEGIQEGPVQQILQNAIAQTYDPNQSLGEGVVPSTATGAGVGAIVQGLTEVVKAALPGKKAGAGAGRSAFGSAGVPKSYSFVPLPADATEDEAGRHITEQMLKVREVLAAGGTVELNGKRYILDEHGKPVEAPAGTDTRKPPGAAGAAVVDEQKVRDRGVTGLSEEQRFEVLRAAGWSAEDIADMDPEAIGVAVEDAVSQGLAPPDIYKDSQVLGTTQEPSTVSTGSSAVSPLPEGEENARREAVRRMAEGGVETQGFLSPEQIQSRLRGTRKAPVRVETAEDLAAVGNQAQPPKSQKQADANNYPHDHIQWNGLDISIETPKGQARQKINDKTGEVIWRTPEMPAHYGYIKGVPARARDKERIDVFFGDNPESQLVFIVDQNDVETGAFDEPKAMLAFPDRAHAVDAYVRSFSDGKGEARLGGITEMSADGFRAWLQRPGRRLKPLSGRTQREPQLDKSLSHRVLADANLLGDSADAETVLSQGFESLQRDRQAVVLAKVRRSLNNDEILRAIVEAIPIDVMHVLVGQKLSAEQLLHNPAVLAHRLAVPRNVPIPQPVNRFIDSLATAIRSPSTFSAAKEPGLIVSQGPDVEGLAASGAVSNAGLGAGAATEEPGLPGALSDQTVSPSELGTATGADKTHVSSVSGPPSAVKQPTDLSTFGDPVTPDQAMAGLVDMFSGSAEAPAPTAAQSEVATEATASEPPMSEGPAGETPQGQESARPKGAAGLADLFGKKAEAKPAKPAAVSIPKKPVTDILKRAGGVDPSSTLAGELRHMDITSRTAPGLFKKGGIGAADNFVADEYDIFAGRGDDSGYVPEEVVLEALHDEYAGRPWLTQEQQDASDDAFRADQDAAEKDFAAAARAEAIEDIEAFGKAELPGFDLTAEEVDRAVELYQQGMPVDNVYERIAFESDRKQRHPEIRAAFKQEWLPGYESDSTRSRKTGTGVSPGIDRQEGAGGEAARVPDRGRETAPAAGETGVEVATEQTEAGEQAVIPGAEKISDAELAQRKADEGLKAKAPQQGAESLGGLFGDDSKQTDLLDLTSKPESLKDLIARKASFDAIVNHPDILGAQARMEAVPVTAKQPGYGTPEYWANRVFNIEGDADTVTGLENFVREFRAKVADAYADGPVAKDKKAIIIIGTPAAGKSTLAKKLAKLHKAAIIDVDDVNQTFPEYQNGLGRHAVHLEGLHVVHNVERSAVEEGANFILPKSGFESRSISDRIKRLKERGYSVDVINVDVDIDEAARRMAQRFLDTGRIVDPDYMRGSGARAKTSYNNLRAEGLADRYAEIDSTGQWPWPIIRDGEALAGIEGYADAADMGAGGAAASTEDLQQSAEPGEAASEAGETGEDEDALDPVRVESGDIERDAKASLDRLGLWKTSPPRAEAKKEASVEAPETGPSAFKDKLKNYSGVNIDGYQGDVPPADEAFGSVKRDFLSDAKSYLIKVSKALQARGFAAHEVKKGRRGKEKFVPGQAVRVNKSGPASSGEVSLSMVNAEGKAFYVQIQGTVMRPDGGIDIRAVKASRGQPYGYGGNIWLPADLTISQFADKLEEIARGKEASGVVSIPSVEQAAEDRAPPTWWNDLTQAGKAAAIRAAESAIARNVSEKTAWHNLLPEERRAIIAAHETASDAKSREYRKEQILEEARRLAPDFNLKGEEIERAIDLHEEGLGVPAIIERLAIEDAQKEDYPDVQKALKETDATQRTGASQDREGLDEGLPRSDINTEQATRVADESKAGTSRRQHGRDTGEEGQVGDGDRPSIRQAAPGVSEGRASEDAGPADSERGTQRTPTKGGRGGDAAARDAVDTDGDVAGPAAGVRGEGQEAGRDSPRRRGDRDQRRGEKPAAEAVDFDAAFDAALDETFGTETPKDTRSTGEVAKSALTDALEGSDAALEALTTLFGGSKLSEGLGFDEETYAKAKPLFIRAAAKFGEVAHDMNELIRRMVGEMQRVYGLTREALKRMRPYLKRFIDDVRDGVISLGKAEAAQLKAAATGDPRIMEHAELTKQERDLSAQKRSHERNMLRGRQQLAHDKERLEAIEKRLGLSEKDLAKVTDISGDNFKIDLTPIVAGEHTDRKKAGDAILKFLESQRGMIWGRAPKTFKIGTISGFDTGFQMWRDPDGTVAARAYIKGDLTYEGGAFIYSPEADPQGLSQRLANLVGAVKKTHDDMAGVRDAIKSALPKIEEQAKAKPWQKAAEYQKVTERLQQLTVELTPKKPGQSGQAPSGALASMAPKKKSDGWEAATYQGYPLWTKGDAWVLEVDGGYNYGVGDPYQADAGYIGNKATLGSAKIAAAEAAAKPVAGAVEPETRQSDDAVLADITKILAGEVGPTEADFEEVELDLTDLGNELSLQDISIEISNAVNKALLLNADLDPTELTEDLTFVLTKMLKGEEWFADGVTHARVVDVLQNRDLPDGDGSVSQALMQAYLSLIDWTKTVAPQKSRATATTWLELSKLADGADVEFTTDHDIFSAAPPVAQTPTKTYETLVMEIAKKYGINPLELAEVAKIAKEKWGWQQDSGKWTSKAQHALKTKFPTLAGTHIGDIRGLLFQWLTANVSKPDAPKTYQPSQTEIEILRVMKEDIEAAKAAEAKGLKLDVKSRDKRRIQMGYTLKAWRGGQANQHKAMQGNPRTTDDEGGVFFTDDPKVANSYAEGNGVIYPVWIRPKGFLEIDWKTRFGGAGYRRDWMNTLIKEARSEGYPGIIARNIDIGASGRQTQIIVLDYTAVRSWFARFDLDAAHSADILASMAKTAPPGRRRQGLPVVPTKARPSRRALPRPALRLRGKEAAELTEAVSQVVNMANRMVGGRVVLEFYDEQIPRELALAGDALADIERREAEGEEFTEPMGFWNPERSIDGDAIIGLAINQDRYGLLTTAGHELWHHIEQRLLNDQERAVLAREMPRLRELAAKELGTTVEAIASTPDYEITAIAFQRYRRERDAGLENAGSGLHIGIRRIFERLWRMLRDIADTIRGKGYRFEDIFETARSGGYANRPYRKPGKPDALASMDPDDRFAAEFMQELASVDDLFRYQRSTASTLEGTLADIAPWAQWLGEDTRPDEAAESGAEQRFLFRNSAGAPFHVFQTEDEVWIDVSNLPEGGGGSAVYAAVGDYAFNTGRVFKGDPAGITPIAIRRRTENMLAQALKHGTTRHLRPHPEQLKAHPELGVSALRWRDGDDSANIQSLIETSVASLAHYVPEIKDAYYDFDTRTFRLGEGEQITDVRFADWRASRGGRAAGAGSATLKRGILLNTLLRASRGKKPGLLERVLRLPDKLVTGTPLEQILYSIAPKSDGTLANIMPTGLSPGGPSGPFDNGGGQSRQDLMGSGFSVQPIDRVLRLPFDIFGGLNEKNEWKPGLWLNKKAAKLLTSATFADHSRFSWLNPILHGARAGLVDRYGLDPAYVELDRVRGLDERRVMAEVPELMQTLKDAKVGAGEARALQAILTGEKIAPEHWKQIAAPIRNAIDALGQEAVELGLVSAESFERNRGSYLHRVYLKHEVDENGLVRWANRIRKRNRLKIIGEQFKGRGLWQRVPLARLARDIPGLTALPQDGSKFRLLHVTQKSPQGKLRDIAPTAVARTKQHIYLRAEEPLPVKFKDARVIGTFEVRGTKGHDVVLWRDYTKEERERMGEIVDARYTIAKTYMLMAHDLATGRFYREIAQNKDWATDAEPAPATWKDAAEYRGRLWADHSVEWVRVPETLIPKSRTKRFGALAGKFVRAEIWRDINEVAAMHRSNWWQAALNQWKLNKTARSPVVHMNNIMSNALLMDMADVSTSDLFRGIRSLVRQDKSYQEAVENGAFGADMVSVEIRRNTLEPLLKEIQHDMRGAVENTNLKIKALGRLANAIWSKAKSIDQKMLDLYRMEDEVFRMATFIRRRRQGADAPAAAIEARDQFLNYDIRAPWVNAARRSVLPFISYTYRAVPIVAKTVMTRPWKLAKYFTIAYGLNALAYAIFPGDDDEDKERRTLREQEQGYTWIGAPRLLRMPFGDVFGNPVFLDIRRWIPAGDVFDINQSYGAIDLPAPLQLGGPIMLAAELLLNKQAFTGKEIVNDLTDDWWDRSAKISDWAWKSWMPSAAWVPGSWYWNKIGNAISGVRDWQGRPYSVPMAALSSIGVKLKPHDVKDALGRIGMEFEKVERELSSQMARLARDRQRGIISEYAYRRQRERLLDKFHNMGERAREVFQGKP